MCSRPPRDCKLCTGRVCIVYPLCTTAWLINAYPSIRTRTSVLSNYWNSASRHGAELNWSDLSHTLCTLFSGKQVANSNFLGTFHFFKLTLWATWPHCFWPQMTKICLSAYLFKVSHFSQATFLPLICFYYLTWLVFCFLHSPRSHPS